MTATRIFMAAMWSVAALLTGLSGCAGGPEVIRFEGVQRPEDGPYGNILVVCLANSFDIRRNLETELVSRLEAEGIDAVASTRMMDSRTPVVAATFVAMVDEIGADSVLLAQPVHLESRGFEYTVNPDATYIFRPTYYYNVFLVDLVEYIQPPEIRFEHDLTLLVELISVRTREPVWAIHTRSQIVWKAEMERDYSAYVEEADVIVRELERDGIIAP